MIALPSVIGKLFHQILAERFEKYVLNNQLINQKFQKAFLQGISGCVEHNAVIHEIIRHAKSNSRTVHFTWFDLEDAFGSVEHDLIFHTLSRLDFPPQIQSYVKNLYSSLSGRAVSKDWTSNEFMFRRGIFQGDPLSPLIFILCFDPIIQFLNENAQFGYNLEGVQFTTAPFADDFCLITHHKRTHQRLINSLSDHTKTMGLKIKPAKCRSLSLSRGSSVANVFTVEKEEIPTLDNEAHKFLGSLITFNNTSSDVADYLSDKIQTSLVNIDSCLVRNEYKLQVYVRYLLPALRYDLTVNDVCSSHLAKMDALTNRFLKK